jgi:hypothetical protein
MTTAKVSISLPDSLAAFIESYRKRRGWNCSQVFEEAVRLLRRREFEANYRDAALKFDRIWENTVTDGLDDEAW